MADDKKKPKKKKQATNIWTDIFFDILVSILWQSFLTQIRTDPLFAASFFMDAIAAVMSMAAIWRWIALAEIVECLYEFLSWLGESSAEKSPASSN